MTTLTRADEAIIDESLVVFVCVLQVFVLCDSQRRREI